MSASNLCRLCVKLCENYRSIYDDSGQRNEVYEITVKYFHPMFLNVEQGGSHQTVMCLDCWHQIAGFYRFQESVLLAQTKLLEGDKQISQSPEKAPADVDSIARIATIDQPDLELMDTYSDNPSATAEPIKIEAATPSIDISADEGSYEDDEPIGYFVNANDVTARSHSELETIEIDSSSSEEDIVSLLEDDDDDDDDSLTTSHTTSNHRSAAVASDGATLSSHDCSTQPGKALKRKRKRKSASEFDSIIAQWNSQLECVVCHKLVTSFSLLRMHFRDNHPTEECHVSCCNLKLVHRFQIERHIRFHQRSRGKYDALDCFIEHYEPHLTCPICAEKRPSFGRLQEHFYDSHPHEKCYIECCERRLPKRYQIVDHIQIHLDGMTFRCKLCDICCVSKKSLIGHMQMRHGKTLDSLKTFGPSVTFKELDDSIAQMMPQLKCGLCSESSSTFTELQAHFRQRHPQEQQCFIECCQRKFHKRLQLEEHLLLHNDPRAFKCLECNDCFNSRSSLYTHGRRQHPISDPLTSDIAMNQIISQCCSTLSCYVCDELFPKFGQLQTHFHQTHPNDVCYVVCCEEKFHSLSPFVMHCKQHHANVITDVGTVRKSFKQLDEFIAESMPKLECVICQRMSATFTELQKHFRKEHPAEKCHIVCCERKLRQRNKIERHILLFHGAKKRLTYNTKLQ